VRIESSVTALSWIPSEAISGLPKLPFELGITHYDDPPPEVIEDLDALIETDAVREANDLRAWIEVEDGKITGWANEGQGRLGVTRVKLGRGEVAFSAVPFPTLQPEPEVGPDSVTFLQTVGGRTALPAPRSVSGKPFFRLASSIAWTTLRLTIYADGSSAHELVGASPFPRHWIYDAAGKLVQKSGLVDFKSWYRQAYGKHSPWGGEDSQALITEVETALERELSRTIMRDGARPKIKKLKEGATLVEQGQPGQELFLLLDGILSVEMNGDKVAEVGPGAVVGERALIEGGIRTSTLRAVTPAKVAIVRKAEIAPEQLANLASTHRREES
jgi:hypothetical protein